METDGLEKIFDSKERTDNVLVLVGLSEEGDSDTLDSFCGDEGTVVNDDIGFDIIKMEMTVGCLEEVVEGATTWVDFIEPSGDEVQASSSVDYNVCL